MDQNGTERPDTNRDDAIVATGSAGARSRLRLVAAVNDPAVLANCLARSPDVATGRLTLTAYENRSSATAAYNEAIADVPDDSILILAHQDVYLPAGWADRLEAMLADLAQVDPGWAVAGLVGKTREDVFVGHVWSTGMDMELVGDRPLPVRVACLDELVLVLRVDSGLRFDPALPGFHLYGVDIVQAALRAGRGAWAIDAPVVHHDKPIPSLDPSYRAAWRHEKRAWRAVLPIPTLIVPLDRQPFRLIRGDIQLRRGLGGGRTRAAPTSDPKAIARRLGWEPITHPS